MAKKIDRIDSVETLEAKLAEMRKAQAVFATFTQEQVDEICKQAAMAADKARIPLAKMAHAETGMGVVEDKVIKNNYASEHVHNYFRNVKTCGVIEENKAAGTKRIAEPVGVVGAVTPTTNPTSTCIFKILICLKTRNAILISPHPTAKRCTIEAARIMREAAEKAGLPENIICWMDEGSIEMTQVMMKEVNLIMATGGAGMVKAAYSSGTPAIGVGPGNCNVIFDDTCDIKNAVSSTIHSKTFDNGMICAAEQHITVLDSIYDKVKKEFQESRCYFLTPEESARVGEVFFNPATHGVKASAVGRPAVKLAEMAGVKVPADTKVLIAETDDSSHDNPWANEKLCPVLGMYRAKNFNEALDLCAKLVSEGGAGHSGALYVDPNEREKIDAFGLRMKAGRILINTPTTFGGLGDLYNFDIAPSLTLGPGTFGGSSFMGQTNIMQLLNIKTVAERRENMLWLRLPEKVYFKKGCTSVALKELKDYYHSKKAFVVTDANLFEIGMCQPILDQLTEMGIATSIFYDIRVDPQIQDAMKGLPAMHEFQPDVIIAIGGGSAIDTAKIMWLMYEHPEENFLDLATVFIDIRKRVYEFPKMGQKAKLVCIPTTAGTGSEVTPFTIISDANTGAKWPLADYELLPTMAIVDADNMMNMPKGVTRASGYDVLTHAVEAYVSVMASDYTDGFALTAIKSVFNYLPRAYKYGAKDPEARIKMADASCLAGIAFANAFLGANHSLAHKLGGWHHIPHGTANALLFTEVCKYNAQRTPTKMGTFSQYKYPHAFERYVEIAEFCGMKGKNDVETFNNFIKAAEDLKAAIDIPASIHDYGIDEKTFMAGLDEMSENAFNDECTGANPVYPLISEIREIYLRAYWGKEYDAKVKAGIPAAEPQMFSNPFGSDYEVQLNGVELAPPAAPEAPEKK
nr:bifunctional acetaldehyde-CoA/alcohol dehydrogenase [uncultured Dysosmobacter sp.]